MLVFLGANLVLLAVPKTGTTALEAALRGRADLAFGASLKHMTARHYQRKVAPFLAGEFNAAPEVAAVMRDPLDQLRSWYRFRARPEIAGRPESTAHRSFDAFVRDALSEPPPPHAKVGWQGRFLSNRRGELLVSHLFAYERPTRLRAFLADRFGAEIAIKVKNVSPSADTSLSPETEAMFRETRAADCALHDRLMAAGGHLHLP